MRDTKTSLYGRPWSMREFNLMIAACWDEDRPDFEACIVLARYAGLRLSECLRLDPETARNALENNALAIKRYDRIRKIPLNKTVRIELNHALRRTPSRRRLFVPDGVSVHTAKKELLGFLSRNGRGITLPSATRQLTFRGLQHLHHGRG